MRYEVIPETAAVYCECGEAIGAPTDGVVVRGAIFVARLVVRRGPDGQPVVEPDGGLVGSRDDPLALSAWHWRCLLRALGWFSGEHASVTDEDADEVMVALYPDDVAALAPQAERPLAPRAT